jgi:hypothetical protein
MRLIFGRTFGAETAAGPLDGPAGKERLIESFTRHNDQVRQGVPAGRLLVYDVAQGWGPLCAFLDVPVPSEPFPHLNRTADFKEMLSES